MCGQLDELKQQIVAPVRERGLKSRSNAGRFHPRAVAPVRERGLKSQQVPAIVSKESRSREGARIEMALFLRMLAYNVVAPARERGLKCKQRRTDVEGDALLP